MADWATNTPGLFKLAELTVIEVAKVKFSVLTDLSLSFQLTSGTSVQIKERGE